MICCKIVSNYRDSNSKFNDLYNRLQKMGNVLYCNGTIYFGTVDNGINNSRIKTIMKKYGYKDCYIEEYDRSHEPREEEYINGWIYDQLVLINTKMYEIKSQEAFRSISASLDKIDKQAEAILNRNKGGC